MCELIPSDPFMFSIASAARFAYQQAAWYA